MDYQDDYETGQTGFPKGENYLYGSLVVVIMVNVIKQVFKDDLLNQSYLLVLFICFCLLIVCLLSVLAKLCVREVRSTSRPVWILKDPDRESRAQKKDHEWESKTKFFRLVEARAVYEIIYKIGLVCLISALLLEGLSFYYNKALKREFDATAAVLAFSGLFLEFMVYQVATLGTMERVKYTYQPFDEFIRVPMRVFIPQMALHLANNLPRIAGIIFYQFSAVYGLITVSRMPEDQIKRFLDATKFAEIHTVMIVAMVLANACGIFLIIENLVRARNFAKDDLLLTFEKNWRWNMAAIEFLLPDKEVESLEELRDAILEKSQEENLTAEERKALRYIQRPLWKSKRPFIGNRELHGIPEVLRTAKPSQEQPSTSKPTQGPQPEEAGPS